MKNTLEQNNHPAVPRARSWIPLFVGLTALAAVGIVAWWFPKTEGSRFSQTQQVLQARAEIRVAMTVTHAVGPLTREQYLLVNKDGSSTESYRVDGRNGHGYIVRTAPRETRDLAFLFGKLVQDGLWKLTSKPQRGDTTTGYAIDAYQLAGKQAGSTSFDFTDPHYWATSAARECQVHLSKDKPVDSTVFLNCTAKVEPGYQQIVDDIRAFGPPEFQAKVTEAQTRLKAKR